MSFRQSCSVSLWSVIFCLFVTTPSAEDLVDASVGAQTDAAQPTANILPTLYSAITPAFSTQPEFSTAQVTVIDASQFAASALSVADVIERAPSVQLQQTGATGSYASVSVRGAPSAQTQIYLDGVLQSNVGGEGGFLQQMSLADAPWTWRSAKRTAARRECVTSPILIASGTGTLRRRNESRWSARNYDVWYGLFTSSS